ncbi:DUF3396 domain-containing protein [Granulicella arctica]|uniref:DUF3396 domain-containing protein n=1 Tax=Granulicella arctica TaxID=940613 RepID=UPI0021DFACB2|nr:DUF3396 domain-containing protein [Granulicella arctica]
MQEDATLSATEIQEVAAGSRFTNVDGTAAIGIGLTALFIFRDGGTVERREAVAAAVREYMEIAGDKLRWRSREGESVNLQAGASQSIEASPWFKDKRGPFEFLFGSGATSIDASPYELGFMCMPSWDPVGISNFSFQLPLAHLNSDFIIRFQRFASLLKADQAYAGIGVLQSPGSTIAARAGHLAYALATRYPGLEVFSPSHFWEATFLKDALGPVNWLTAVGDHYLERLGGWEKVSRGLDPRIAIYRYDGGVIFQAGAKPDMGDAGGGTPPELYRQVARVLRPIRFSGAQHGFFRPSDKGATFDTENTVRWVARFD